MDGKLAAAAEESDGFDPQGLVESAESNVQIVLNRLVKHLARCNLSPQELSGRSPAPVNAFV